MKFAQFLIGRGNGVAAKFAAQTPTTTHPMCYRRDILRCLFKTFQGTLKCLGIPSRKRLTPMLVSGRYHSLTGAQSAVPCIQSLMRPFPHPHRVIECDAVTQHARVGDVPLAAWGPEALKVVDHIHLVQLLQGVEEVRRRLIGGDVDSPPGWYELRQSDEKTGGTRKRNRRRKREGENSLRADQHSCFMGAKKLMATWKALLGGNEPWQLGQWSKGRSDRRDKERT